MTEPNMTLCAFVVHDFAKKHGAHRITILAVGMMWPYLKTFAFFVHVLTAGMCLGLFPHFLVLRAQYFVLFTLRAQFGLELFDDLFRHFCMSLPVFISEMPTLKKNNKPRIKIRIFSSNVTF
tara:strand:+ start:82 stop:447 length:366 start_codon:yes stop_codon:yes gene_type:complete